MVIVNKQILKDKVKSQYFNLNIKMTKKTRNQQIILHHPELQTGEKDVLNRTKPGFSTQPAATASFLKCLMPLWIDL